MNRRFRLEEAVREARSRTGVPGIAAGLSVDGEDVLAADGELVLGSGEPVRLETPFRIASITKPFTATLAASCLELDERVSALLSHTADLRCESPEELPERCRGLWSYSNAGYWEVGSRVEGATGEPFAAAMRSRVLEPLGLAATGFDEPPAAARGHVQEGESGHRAVTVDTYAAARRPSGGLWSTAADLLSFGRRHLKPGNPLHVPQAEALGARYALGFWVRDLGGRAGFDHEGSVAGYQSLLLLVPEENLVLAVLTNSWRGSSAIRRVVETLGLAPAAGEPERVDGAVAGVYALDGVEANVALDGDGLRVVERETDPVTGTAIERVYPARSLGGSVFGTAGGLLQSHRLDFPRSDVARIGWVALPRVAS
jgi:CubicO group peptidase (beta-lactamase class C family)